jgi:hypothetical protein
MLERLVWLLQKTCEISFSSSLDLVQLLTPIQIVPDNSIATLPATAVAWPELFNNGVANLPGTQTWQATVFGNRVNDQYVAGLVYIAQNPLRALQGFITSINYATGHFTLAGKFNPAGYIDCVLNDPLGVFGPVYTKNPLWSLDPVNPSLFSPVP